MKNGFTWNRVFRLANKQWLLIVMIIIAMITNSLLAPIPPIVIAELIDNGFNGTSDYAYQTLLWVLVGIGCLSILSTVTQEISIDLISANITENVRNEIFDKLNSQSLHFFTNSRIGEIISRINDESAQVGESAFRPLVYIIQTVMVLMTTIVTMFFLHWQMTFIMLALIPLMFLPLPIAGAIAYRYSKRLVEKLATFNSYVNQNLNINGIMLNKIFGRNKLVRSNFMSLTKGIKSLHMKQVLVSQSYDNLFSFAILLSPILVFWLGRPGSSMEMTAGVAVAFYGYIATLFNPLQQIGQISITLKSTKAVFERFFQYMDLKTVDNGNGIYVNRLNGNILLNNVSFEYPGKHQALKNISTRINSKEKIGIVGPSGSGKTTLTYLLTALYKYNEGEILIDGYHLNELSRETIANSISMVSQEVYILNTTILENIMISKPDANFTDVEKAAKQANIYEKIMSLQNGFETIVGERGYTLSGGEKQRIAIARVFLKDPSILILDEATSSLDNENEKIIGDAIDRLTGNRTVICIAHRLSTIKNCDFLIYLKNGEIAEQGTYTELMNRKREFYKLFENQSRSVAAMRG